MKLLQGENKLVFVENGKLRFSKINISDFNYENISNDKLVVPKAILMREY